MAKANRWQRWMGRLAWVALLGLISTPPGVGLDGESLDARVSEITPAARVGISRGLAYLAASQKTDGSWGCDVGFKLFDDYVVTSTEEEQEQLGGGHVGVTGLAGIAFIAGGHLPGRGQYGRVVSRALGYVLSQVKEDGYVTDNGSRMYSHAFATLFLAEVFGMTRRTDVRERLQLAVDLIVRSQNDEGSWRYLPFASDSDMSITVCQVMALRAAKNTGIRVPKSTIDAAVDYVKSSKIEYGPHKGGFTYQSRQNDRSRTSFSLTAAGVASLHNAAVYSDQDIQDGLNYLERQLTRFSQRRDHYFYFYGHYYAVQAMYTAGSPYWEKYFRVVREQLLRDQAPDGSWKSNVGRPFSTAMAAIILQVPLRYLPIIQR